MKTFSMEIALHISFIFSTVYSYVPVNVISSNKISCYRQHHSSNYRTTDDASKNLISHLYSSINQVNAESSSNKNNKNNNYEGSQKNMTVPSSMTSVISGESRALSSATNETSNSPSGPIKQFTTLLSLILKINILKIKLAALAVKNTSQKIFSTSIFNRKGLTSAPKTGKETSKLVKLLMRLKLMMSKRSFWIRSVAVIGAVVAIDTYAQYLQSLTTEISFASFVNLVNTVPNEVKSLRVSPTSFAFLLDGRNTFTRIVNIDSNMMMLLLSKGVDFAAARPSSNLFALLPWLFYFGYMWRVLSKLTQGPVDSTPVGKNRDQLNLDMSLSFDDIAGQELAKREVKEVVDMLSKPSAYKAIGARLPAGLLLVGPPGTGKTLLARVTAAEARVPFYAISASEFVEVFVGKGASRVRQLFKRAEMNAPCIIFIDELDSIGRSRRLGSMNSEQENTLNQILTCMDGLDTSNNGVIVMAATNRLELLDPALLRAGRFDRIIQCPLPDKNGRLAILKIYAKKLQLADDVDLDRIARLTAGFCGADLAAVTNEAAIRTVRRRGYLISNTDYEDALRTFSAGRGGLSLSAISEGLSTIPTFSNWMKGLNPDPPAQPSL